MPDRIPRRTTPARAAATRSPPPPTSGLGIVDPSDRARYDELRCRFSGTAIIRPGIPAAMDAPPQPQTMELAKGAAFDCSSSEGRSAGTIAMTTTFLSTTAFAGQGTGSGTITWSDPPPGVGREQARTPSTVEQVVDLKFPDIVVRISITGGPYAGYKGILPVSRWEITKSAQNAITEVKFAPTSLSLGNV